MEYREPVQKNREKVAEIEKKRRKKGDALNASAHYYMVSEPKSFMIVDIDDMAKLAKWADDYFPYMKYKITPILTREEYDKVT